MNYEEMINDELDSVLETLEENKALDSVKIMINDDIYYNVEMRESFEYGLDNDSSFKDYVYLNSKWGSYTFYKKDVLESQKMLPLEVVRAIKEKLGDLECKAYEKGGRSLEMRVGRSIFSCLNVFEYMNNLIKEKKGLYKYLNRYNITMEHKKVYDKALYYKLNKQLWKTNA